MSHHLYHEIISFHLLSHLDDACVELSSLLEIWVQYSPESTRQSTRLSRSGARPIVGSTDTLPRTDNDRSSNYDKALCLLKNSPPEQRLDIRLPPSQYLKLEESWSKFKSENNIREEKRYPSLSYNSLMQIVTVITTQSALHGYTVAWFRDMIGSSVKGYLATHKPSKSSKEPDQSFSYDRSRGRPSVHVVIECGVSEDYRALCDDKDLWLQRLGAKAVVLICLKETPRFKNPRAAYQNIDDVVAEVERMDQHVDGNMKHNLEQGKYGPSKYRNHMWFGRLNELFLEVWRADGKQPVRKWLIKDRHSYNPLPRTTGVKISDFFPDDEWTACKIPDSNVRFRRDFFGVAILGMRETAADRFIDFLSSFS
ncbi:uncharacterized protein V1513DRAFT_479156 [Lipomyces chichibuensis]|uniref:uncharacterized protein n=1 Tax=Lipomyces chichibuensis TaxID=1546026 RepID=UPI003343FEC9